MSKRLAPPAEPLRRPRAWLWPRCRRLVVAALIGHAGVVAPMRTAVANSEGLVAGAVAGPPTPGAHKSTGATSVTGAPAPAPMVSAAGTAPAPPVARFSQYWAWWWQHHVLRVAWQSRRPVPRAWPRRLRELSRVALPRPMLATAVADLDGDGHDEIVVVGRDRLVVLQVWPRVRAVADLPLNAPGVGAVGTRPAGAQAAGASLADIGTAALAVAWPLPPPLLWAESASLPGAVDAAASSAAAGPVAQGVWVQVLGREPEILRYAKKSYVLRPVAQAQMSGAIGPSEPDQRLAPTARAPAPAVTAARTVTAAVPGDLPLPLRYCSDHQGEVDLATRTWRAGTGEFAALACHTILPTAYGAWWHVDVSRDRSQQLRVVAMPQGCGAVCPPKVGLSVNAVGTAHVVDDVTGDGQLEVLVSAAGAQGGPDAVTAWPLIAVAGAVPAGKAPVAAPVWTQHFTHGVLAIAVGSFDDKAGRDIVVLTRVGALVNQRRTAVWGAP